MKKSLIAVMMTGICLGVAQAATNYIVPWYVNPAVKTKLWTGKDAFNAVDLRFGERGDRLFATFNESDKAWAIAYDMAKLSTLTGVQTNWHNGLMSASGNLPASARVAVSSARNAYLGINPEDGTGYEAPAGHAQWVGSFAPTSVTFGGAIPATSFGFNAAGDVLWSNCTTAGDEGKLVKWTCSNGTFSSAGTVDTGLAAVEAVALYTVNGTEYVLAAGGGTVKFVNAASGVVKYTVSDATHLSSTIRAVRMSHCDFFRPRLYALLDTGDVAAYYLNRELNWGHWSKTHSNAALLTASGAPFAAESATVVAFDVTPDGGTAAIGYAQNADDESTPTGPAYLTLLKHTPRKWTYYAAGAEGNPSANNVNCVTDGEWILSASVDTTNKKATIGTASGQSNRGSAYLNGGNVAEYLDFSGGVVYAGSTACSITAMAQWSLGVPGEMPNPPCRLGPRVFLQSPNFANASQWMKGLGATENWASGSFEEMIMDSTVLDWIGSWTNFTTNNLFMVLHYPKLATADRFSVNPNNQKPYGVESRWEDSDFSALSTVYEGAFADFNAAGVLTLPSAMVISNSAFAKAPKMTEVRIAETKKTLKRLHGSAFSPNTTGQMKRAVLGCANGCTIWTSAFSNQSHLEEVVFTGAVPSFNSTSVAWPDTAANTLTFAVPRGDSAWDAILNDPSKVKNRLTVEQQQAYRLANPGKYVPIGTLDKSVLQSKYDQYVAYNDMKSGVKLEIERDTFFDDQVVITSDWAPAADGTYLPGTRVTLRAQPNATGTFVKWYGDVDRAVETNAEITITVNADTWLYCRIVHPWTLSSDKKTLTNGNFTLNCSVKDEGARTLNLGSWAKYGLFNAADTGIGIVDLGGPITQAGDSAKWKIAAHLAQGGLMVGKRGAQGGGMTGLIFPGTLETTPSGQWAHATTIDLFGISYRTLIMDEPAITGNPFPDWTTCGHYDLDRFILRIPKVTSISGDPSFWNISAAKSKFDWWDVSSLNYIAARAFCGYDWNNRLLLGGTLTLPSLCSVTNTALYGLKNCTEISLGGLDKTKTVKRLFTNTMTGNTSLRKLTMYNDKDLVIDGDVFNTAANTPKEIVLTGKVATNDIFAKLLNKITAAATKPVKVYVPAAQGWGSAPYIDAPTAAERDEAPGEVVLGVYRGDAAAPNGKALLINRPGPYDPKGICLIIR